MVVPSNIAKDVIRDLITKGEVERGYLGVYYQEITQEMAEGLGLEKTGGVIISQVAKDSPADKGGLKEGDIIVEFDGQEVSFSQFPFMVAKTQIGEKVNIKVIRDKKEITLKVKIGRRPAEEKPIKTEEEERKWLGIEVAELSSEEARAFDIEEKEGVLITDVQSDGAAYGYIERGDVIKKINNEYVRNVSDYEAIRKEIEESDRPIVFLVKRKTRSIFVTITP